MLCLQVLSGDGGICPEQDRSKLSLQSGIFLWAAKGRLEGTSYANAARYMIWMNDGRFWSIVEGG
jgi:hypothetical protein